MSAGFGLYVHWPFCTAKCPYCDFNSHVRQNVDQGRWAEAFEQEIEFYRRRTGPRVLTSIFFGGGTPSLMEPFVVDRVIAAARSAWNFSNDIEITLEANPTSVEVGRFEKIALAGVNRVSLGLQALNDADLRQLGRTHSSAEGLSALKVANETFSRVSCDLMYGRQNQSAEAWKTELEQVLGLGLKHLSLYQLTIEPDTIFGKRAARGTLRGLPDEDRSIELWTITNQICHSGTLDPYETSNFCVSGQESRHNLTYWRSGDWVGIGPGAHGRLTVGGKRYATETALHPEAWLERVDSLSTGETQSLVLDLPAIREERLLMGLRLTDGIDLEPDHLSEIERSARDAGIDHLLEITQSRLAVTDEGRLLLNAILQIIA